MDFKLIGKLCEYGVDFAPTQAGMTRSCVRDWQRIATNDKDTIKKWFKEDGYHSLVAVAKQGHAFMLDMDDPAACQAMGFKDEWLEGMFGVTSPSGGQHWYGMQDEGFGSLPSVVNIHIIRGDRESKKVMEIKIDRCSVAAPTAKREGQPNKVDGVYEPITGLNGNLRKGLHPELLAWIQEHAEPVKERFSDEAHADWTFHPSFSVDSFCEDNQCSEYLSGMLEPGTFVIVPEECPLCGHHGNQSTLAAGVTKFFFSGSSYGFSCKACGTHTRDEYEEKMTEMHDEFDAWSGYAIYEHEDRKLMAANDTKLLAEMGIEDVENEPEPGKLTMVTAEELFSDAPKTVMPEQLEAAFATPVKKPEDPLKMSDDVMYGKLGQMAHDMEMPCGLAYPALLACYSAKVIHHEMDSCRTNAYVCLLAKVGGGKDVARSRACQILGMHEGEDYTVAMPVSDRGVQTLLGDQPPAKKGEPVIKGPKRMLLVTEEIEELVKKGSIDKSGLFQTLQTLWDGNQKTFAGSMRNGGKAKIDCRLSWLGGIPVNADNAEKFAAIFGETATHGLLSRFLLGYSGVKFNYRKWNPPQPVGKEYNIGDGSEVDFLPDPDWQPPTYVHGMTQEAEAFYEAWISTDESGRDKYYLHKVAILTASANDEKWVSIECVQAAARFMAWQAKLKVVFSPGVAENSIEARCTERILDTLRRMDAAGKVDSKGFIKWRRVGHDNKWAATYGASLVARVINGLTEVGELAYNSWDNDGKTEYDKTKVRVAKVRGEKDGDGENGATE